MDRNWYATEHFVAERNAQVRAQRALHPAHARSSHTRRAGLADLRAWFSRRAAHGNPQGATTGGSAMISACLPDVSPR
jgi:hypothetical protein